MESKASLNPTGPSSAVIECHRAVQKHTTVNPETIQSNERAAAPKRVGAPVLWRTCSWGGCSKITRRSEVMDALKAGGELGWSPFGTKETGGARAGPVSLVRFLGKGGIIQRRAGVNERRGT